MPTVSFRQNVCFNKHTKWQKRINAWSAQQRYSSCTLSSVGRSSGRVSLGAPVIGPSTKRACRVVALQVSIIRVRRTRQLSAQHAKRNVGQKMGSSRSLVADRTGPRFFEALLRCPNGCSTTNARLKRPSADTGAGRGHEAPSPHRRPSYSLAGCSSAEPVSASPGFAIRPNRTVGHRSHPSKNLPRVSESSH